MKTFFVQPGDTVRIYARDVTNLDTGAVTSGLTGTVQLVNHTTEANVGAASPITLHSGDDWYVDVTMPVASGVYRAEIALAQGGASRTLQLLLDAQ